MLAVWIVMLISSLGVAAMLVRRGRRRGDDAKKIISQSLLVGIPLSASIDHIVSGSRHVGGVSVVGTLLVVLGMLWILIQFSQRSNAGDVLPNQPLQRMNACAARSSAGRAATPRAGARGSSRP